MAHTPYGYIIRNGKAVIDAAAAERVKELFEGFLAGLSLENAGKKAGIDRCHASLGKMLMNAQYIDDIFYPPIIGRWLFDQTQAERQHRAEMLGRVGGQKYLARGFHQLQFHVAEIIKVYDNPFMQAEYAYSLISSEEISDDK